MVTYRPVSLVLKSLSRDDGAQAKGAGRFFRAMQEKLERAMSMTKRASQDEDLLNFYGWMNAHEEPVSLSDMKKRYAELQALSVDMTAEEWSRTAEADELDALYDAVIAAQERER